MKVKRNTKKSVSITFIAIYILGIVMMFMNPHEATAYIVPTLVGLGGAVGMIRYVLPDVVRNLKEVFFLQKICFNIYFKFKLFNSKIVAFIFFNDSSCNGNACYFSG